MPETLAVTEPPVRARETLRRIGRRVYDSPPLTGQYDSTAAVTAIATFAACPRKYFLSTVTVGEVRGGEGGIATGLAAHRILAGETVDAAEAAVLAQTFTDSDLGHRAVRASRIEREFDFLLNVDDVVLRGQIDLWFEESGELILVDYKTDRDELASSQYHLQLRLYALAIERYSGRLPDRAVLYYLRSNRMVEVGISEAELDEARVAVREFRDTQESLEFPLKVGPAMRTLRIFRQSLPVRF